MSDRKIPAPVSDRPLPSTSRSSRGEIGEFIAAAKAVRPSADGQGRLVLALDATMSRQPTWDLACSLQGRMFDAVGTTPLKVQLVYFRGAGECRSSSFVGDTESLKRLMSRIDCRGGHTQIGKVLTHSLRVAEEGKVGALVFIGDAMEEDIDDLCDKAARLGMKGVPIFLFQEGNSPEVEQAFREIARLSRGAWFRFDRNAPAMLEKLLGTIAVYATGGLKALQARGRPEDRLLIENMTGGGRR